MHGTVNASSIGSAASDGCFRIYNKYVIDLYDRVHIGAPVYVIEELAPQQVAAQE